MKASRGKRVREGECLYRGAELSLHLIATLGPLCCLCLVRNLFYLPMLLLALIEQNFPPLTFMSLSV